MHVTLRNKKNIGLICFMFISSSYFWLLCRTKTAWWSKNEKMFQIGQNQSKKYVGSDVVTQKIQYQGVLTVYLLILKMFQTDFCCTMNICPSFFAIVGSVNNIKVLWPNYLVFSLVKLFFLASPLSFLASLVLNANASKKWKFAMNLY